MHQSPQQQPQVQTAGPGVQAKTDATTVQTKVKTGEKSDIFERQGDQALGRVMAKSAAGGDEGVQRKEETSSKVQTKMSMSQPGDRHEKEADSMADKVMRMSDPTPSVQRKGEAEVAKKTAESVPTVQASAPAPIGIAPETQQRIEKSATGGQNMPMETQRFMEDRFQADFSQVKVHNDPEAASLNSNLGARAFTYQNHVYFNTDQYQPESKEGRHLIAHELTHVIQQGHAVQRKEEVSSGATPTVQRFGVSDALNYFANAAYAIPGFRMFTIIIGINPINMEAADRSIANILRAIVEFLPGGIIITQVLDRYGVFEKAGTWVEQQLSTLGISGASIRKSINEFLDSLGWRDIFDLGGVWNNAKRIFTEPINRIITFIGSLFSMLMKMIREAVLKPLAGLAQGTRGYDLLKAVLGSDPITGEAVPRNADTLIGGFMKLIGQEEVWENLKKGNAVQRAWAWFQGALAGVMAFVRGIPALIINTLTSIVVQDFLSLDGLFNKVVKPFVNFVGDFLKWGLDQVIELLKILFSVVAPGAMPYIQKAKAAFNTIIKNPIGFVGNLVNAGKKGFQLFADNILTHLKTALIKWITGPLGEAGVYIPKSFSLMEIIKLVLSILGLTWQNIRSKLVKIIPNPVLEGLEKTASILVTLVKEGPAAAWQQIKGELEELKSQLIEQVMQMISTEIVKVAVIKLAMLLNPAGAVIEAILAIYNAISVFVERLQQIGAVVAAFIDSIAAIAAGQVMPAAKKVEQTLANILTVALAFLAKFIGLGGVPAKVVGIVKKIRQPIDKGLDKIVGWLGGILKKLMGKNKKDERTEEQKKSDLEKALNEGDSLFSGTDVNLQQVEKKLNNLKSKYKLEKLEIVIDSSTGDEQVVYLYGEINPKSNKPKHRVKKGGPNSIISEADLSFSRPKFRPKTKKQLRELNPQLQNTMKRDGTFKSKKKWHRRHVVSWGDMVRYYIGVFKDKTVKDAAIILNKEGINVEQERTIVVKAIKNRALNAFNDVSNLFIDIGSENSSIQDILDDKHPSFFNEKFEKVISKVDKAVKTFIENHSIGGFNFNVSVSDGFEVEWEVIYND